MVCRWNYSLHKHDPPLLFDLHSDPSEQYPLSAKEYNQLLIQINAVSTVFVTIFVFYLLQSHYQQVGGDAPESVGWNAKFQLLPARHGPKIVLRCHVCLSVCLYVCLFVCLCIYTYHVH